MSYKTTYYCDICKKEYNPGGYGETGVFSIKTIAVDDRSRKFRANYDVCESCLTKVKKAISEIVNIKWKEEI